jgi:hypothetical protein
MTYGKSSPAPDSMHVHVMSTSKVLFSSKLNMFLANVLNIDKLEKFWEVEVTIILFQSLTIYTVEVRSLEGACSAGRSF